MKRVLTVAEVQRGRPDGLMTRYTPTPAIRLVGLYLAEAGFEPGTCVEVVPERDKIVITPKVPDQENKET